MKLVVAKGHGDPLLNDITRKSLDLIRVIGEIKPLTHQLIHDGQVTGSDVDLNNRLTIEPDLRSFVLMQKLVALFSHTIKAAAFVPVETFRISLVKDTAKAGVIGSFDLKLTHEFVDLFDLSRKAQRLFCWFKLHVFAATC